MSAITCPKHLPYLGGDVPGDVGSHVGLATSGAPRITRHRMRHKQTLGDTGDRLEKQGLQPVEGNEVSGDDTSKSDIHMATVNDHVEKTSEDVCTLVSLCQSERGTFPNATMTTCYLASTLQCLHSSSAWSALVQKHEVHHTCASTQCGWCLLRRFESITRTPDSFSNLLPFAPFFQPECFWSSWTCELAVP